MSMESRHRYQDMVLWEASGSHDNFGTVTIEPPIDLKVRWEERQGQTIDAHGDTIGLDAFVVVDRVIAVGSIVRLGTTSELPSSPDNLYKVTTVSAVPNVKGRVTRRTLGLQRFSNTLPSFA